MTDDELRERAQALSASGKTYAQIAEEFARGGVPGTWTRTSVERLLGVTSEPAIRVRREAAAPPVVDPVVAALGRIEAHSLSTARWTSLIGWIVLAWAVASMGVGIWLGVVMTREARASDPEPTTGVSYLDQ